MGEKKDGWFSTGAPQAKAPENGAGNAHEKTPMYVFFIKNGINERTIKSLFTGGYIDSTEEYFFEAPEAAWPAMVPILKTLQDEWNKNTDLVSGSYNLEVINPLKKKAGKELSKIRD